MAEELGIGKISGIPIANVGKMGVVAKANAWAKSGEQRESSLFSNLLNNGWSTYTAGKNSASFTASPSSGTLGYTYFSYGSNDGRNTYNFKFNKIGATTAENWIVGISIYPDFRTLLGHVGISGEGTLTPSIAIRDRTSTIYIGVLCGGQAIETATINDLTVNIS